MTTPLLRRSDRGPQAATPLGIGLELATGMVLLGLAALAGIVFVRRAWPNRLDIWGYRVLPGDANSHVAHAFVALGSTAALVIGAFAILGVGLLRDWARAVACAVAPIIAVVLVESIAKPLVGRHNLFTGGLSYPSGTVAAVAALATAATLVVPRLARPFMALLGVLATLGTCAAVVVLRWHYPTDALGGVAVGVGSVLVIDALAHAPWVVRRWWHPADPRRPAGERPASVLV